MREKGREKDRERKTERETGGGGGRERHKRDKIKKERILRKTEVFYEAE